MSYRVLKELNTNTYEDFGLCETKEEAVIKAKRLNEIPENKKRAEQWFRDRQTILEMQYCCYE